MAKQSIQMWDAEVFTAADAVPLTGSGIGVTGNGQYELCCSAEISNSSALRNLEMVISYEESLPNQLPFGFDLDCVVEGLIGTQWSPIAYQFNSFNRPYRGVERIIRLQPNIVVIDNGVDDIIYAGGETKARISRQQGQLPDSKFRVKIYLTEYDFGGPGAFQTVKISAAGESFDV